MADGEFVEKAYGDVLVRRLRAGTHRDSASDLLRALFAGYPVERLRDLLIDERDSVVDASAWILHELDSVGLPLLGDAVRLLGHPNGSVRASAVQIMLVLTGESDGEAISQAIRLIDDPNDEVRSRVLSFLADASLDQLRSGVVWLEPGPLRELVSWLIGCATLDASSVGERLEDSNSTMRYFAAAAAVRRKSFDEASLHKASLSNDPLIVNLAKLEMDLSGIEAAAPRRRNG